MNAATKEILSKKLNAKDLQIKSIGGGSINETYKLTTTDKNFFCKTNSATKFPQLFIKEQNGLQLLQQQNIIKVPAVIDAFETEDTQVLLLEWIEEGERTLPFWKKFGEQLAAIHQINNHQYGLEEDNYMGSVPQQNNFSSDWINFFIQQRLEPLIMKCSDKNLLNFSHQQKFKNLYKHLPSIFTTEKPSLLHGDLWSGNFMCSATSEPVLIDPAVYYGHRSVDLGMTTLFGCFDKKFYDAYQYQFPFPSNYKEQWQVSNLYPLLIHLFLFGASYLGAINSVLDTYK